MDATEAFERARDTWAAIEARLGEPGTGLYGERRGRFRRSRRYEHLWPFAGAWSASCALAALEGPEAARSRLERQLAALEHYRRPGDVHGGLAASVVPPLGPGGDRYFDDNAWIGLALCRQARLTGDGACVAKAVELAEFVAFGWSTDRALSHVGGVRWKEGAGPGGRNTCANGPAAALAAELFLRGEGAGCLAFATRVYAWTRAVLGTPGGLYADRIAPGGVVTPAVLSYNQGSMIGAGLLLHSATGEARYLEDATGTALAALERYGDGPALAREPPGFVAVFLRNLLALDAAAPNPAYRRLAAAYGEALMRARDNDGLVGPAAGASSVLLASAALVEVLALLAGAPAWP